MKRLILALIIIPFVYACGSVSEGDSSSSFESVRVYASGSSVEGGAYDADSIDKGSGSCDNASNYTFTPDEVTVNVKSEALPNLPSDLELAEVEVYKITVSFIPNDDISPEISTKEYNNVSTIIEPDSTTNISVRIIDRIEKVDNSSPLYYFDNVGKEYNYTVKLQFKAEELLYGGTDSFSYSFQLRYFDKVDECT